MSQIHIVCGVGGAGKTTLAAAMGVHAAHKGARAVVLTIDPARRLADALGLDTLGNEPTRVPLASGHLDALMLDRKATFDGLIRAHAPSDDLADRVFANRYYDAVSTRLTGGHELMAVERLHQLVADGRWDVIIVDTPPARHALDFLRAPDRITALLDHRLAAALFQPSDTLLGAATARAAGFVRRLAGGSVIDDLAEFFSLIQLFGDGFRTRGADVASWLRDARSTCWLVAPADNPRTDELLAFQDALRTERLHLAGVLLNRVTTPLAAPPDTMLAAFSAASTAQAAHDWLAQDLAHHAARAARHDAMRVDLHTTLGLDVWPIAEIDGGVPDLADLDRIAHALP